MPIGSKKSGSRLIWSSRYGSQICLTVWQAVLTGEQQTGDRSLVTRHSLREERRSNARILLVEDNLTNQEVASGMLRRLGWNADVASDGKTGLAGARNAVLRLGAHGRADAGNGWI